MLLLLIGLSIPHLTLARFLVPLLAPVARPLQAPLTPIVNIVESLVALTVFLFLPLAQTIAILDNPVQRITENTVIAAHGDLGRFSRKFLLLDRLQRSVIDQSLTNARIIFRMFFSTQVSLIQSNPDLLRCLRTPRRVAPSHNRSSRPGRTSNTPSRSLRIHLVHFTCDFGTVAYATQPVQIKGLPGPTGRLVAPGPPLDPDFAASAGLFSFPAPAVFDGEFFTSFALGVASVEFGDVLGAVSGPALGDALALAGVPFEAYVALSLLHSLTNPFLVLHTPLAPKRLELTKPLTNIDISLVALIIMPLVFPPPVINHHAVFFRCASKLIRLTPGPLLVRGAGLVAPRPGAVVLGVAGPHG